MDLKGAARRWLGGDSSPSTGEAQEFSVSCQFCGEEVQGRRTDGYQAIRCPSCGNGLFVLPKSVFRSTPAPARRKPVRARAVADHFADAPEIVWTDPIPPAPAPTSEAEVVEIEWEDDAPAEPPPPPQPPSAPQKARKVAPPSQQVPSSPPPEKQSSRPAIARAATAPQPPPPPPRRRQEVAVEEEFVSLPTENRKPPILLIFLAVGALVIATVGYRYVQARRQDYPRLVAEGMERGIPALEEGKFDLAKRILTDAAAAAEGLNRQVEHADEVIEAAQEAALFTDLVSEPLETIVDQAARHRPAPEWPEYFRLHFRGQSVVMEATLATDSGPRGYELDYRILVGPGPKADRVGRIDLRGFKLFEDQLRPKPGQSLVFGARLESVALDEETGEWLVRFQPDSGKIITHLRALTALGWGKTTPDPPPAPIRKGEDSP